MSTDVEIDRVVAAVTATLNDQALDSFDPARVQELMHGALGGASELSVDDGGGIHDASGRRVASVRRSDSGEWIVDRQNETAERSDTAIPTQPPQSKLRKLLTKLKLVSS